MCGRYSIVVNEEQLRQQFGPALGLAPGVSLADNYNVAPTQRGYVITDREPDRLNAFRWGLIPFWAKDPRIGARMINARAEGIEDKSSFRKPIRERRCLVVADSFYEWKREGKTKTPYRILPEDGSLLVLAGIWESWRNPAAATEREALVRSYSIITGEPNAEMRPLHDRMPRPLLTAEQRSRWLDPDLPLAEVLGLLETPPDGILRSYPVSPAVGNVRNNGPELHLPLRA